MAFFAQGISNDCSPVPSGSSCSGCCQTCCTLKCAVVRAATARKPNERLSVIGGNLGSAASSGGVFSDGASSEADELDFDKWQVRGVKICRDRNYL